MLDQIQEIILKYSFNFKVVIRTDLNAPITDSKYSADHLALKFFSDLQLIPEEYLIGNTFYHFNGNKRLTDYILSKIDIRDIKIHEQDPFNTSTHLPITTTLSFAGRLQSKE